MGANAIGGVSIFDIVFSIHSHPFFPPEHPYYAEAPNGGNGTEGASGGDRKVFDALGGFGDMASARRLHRKYKEAGMKSINEPFMYRGKSRLFPKLYVFHQKSKKLLNYTYTPWIPSRYIRTIKSSDDLHRNLGF